MLKRYQNELTSNAFAPFSTSTAFRITLFWTSLSRSRIPTSCGPVYGGSGEVIGVKLNTRIQKRKDADVKRMMRRGVNRLKPNTMTNAVQLYGEVGFCGDG
jgi:hypothetical protein